MDTGVMKWLLSMVLMAAHPPDVLYKIVSQETWERSQESCALVLPAMDTPFIHLATKEQVPRILEKYFSDEPTPKILKLDVTQLPGKLVLEKNPGGTQEYYHLYNGSLPKKAILSVDE